MNQEIIKYYSDVPDNSRAQLDRLRKIIMDLLPSSKELIKYGIPTFVINNESVIGIGGWNNFVSLYPYGSYIIEKYKNELKDLKTTKGAIQFELNKPLPKTIIKKIVFARLNDLNIR